MFLKQYVFPSLNNKEPSHNVFICIFSVGGRRSQRSGPSPQWRHKSQVSLWGPPCAHGVAGTPHGEVRDTIDVV